MDTQQQIPNSVSICLWETVKGVENFAWARDCFYFTLLLIWVCSVTPYFLKAQQYKSRITGFLEIVLQLENASFMQFC